MVFFCTFGKLMGLFDFWRENCFCKLLILDCDVENLCFQHWKAYENNYTQKSDFILLKKREKIRPSVSPVSD